MLPRHQPNPGCETTARRECLPIPDLGNQSSGDDRANARDFLQSSAFFTRPMPGVDVLLEGYDLGRDRYILAGENDEAQARCRRDAIIFLVSNDLQQFRRTIAALRRDDTELCQVPTDRVRQHCALTDEELTAAM